MNGKGSQFFTSEICPTLGWIWIRLYGRRPNLWMSMNCMRLDKGHRAGHGHNVLAKHNFRNKRVRWTKRSTWRWVHCILCLRVCVCWSVYECMDFAFKSAYCYLCWASRPVSDSVKRAREMFAHIITLYTPKLHIMEISPHQQNAGLYYPASQQYHEERVVTFQWILNSLACKPNLPLSHKHMFAHKAASLFTVHIQC